MTLTVTPVKGNPIYAAWGKEIRDRTNQAFADKAALDTWNDAPEGAQAITLGDYRLWIRRAGIWQPPLTLPLGLYYANTNNDLVQITSTGGGVPGVTDWALWMDQYRLLARRLYMVFFSCRVQAQTGAPVTYGGVINVDTGTELDYPLTYHGNMPGFYVGQEAVVYGWPLERNGAAYRASAVGMFRTGGAVGANVDVAFQHTIITTPTGCVVQTNARSIQVLDMGPG